MSKFVVRQKRILRIFNLCGVFSAISWVTIMYTIHEIMCLWQFHRTRSQINVFDIFCNIFEYISPTYIYILVERSLRDRHSHTSIYCSAHIQKCCIKRYTLTNTLTWLLYITKIYIYIYIYTLYGISVSYIYDLVVHIFLHIFF